MSTDVVVATDLDQTLIFGSKSMNLTVADADAPRLLCVEVYRAAPLSFMTETAASHVAELAARGALVPTTTRTLEQYQRLHLPGPLVRYAVVANGGRILHHGVEDEDFTAEVAARLDAGGVPLAEIWQELSRVAEPVGDGPIFVTTKREVLDLFCYAVLDPRHLPAGWVEHLTGFAAERGWGLTRQGRKVYLVPSGLTKAVAARTVADRLGASRLLAAGDSLLDGELLAESDAGIRPAHGELFDTGWSRPHVTQTAASGIMAGEEVAAWLRSQVG